MKIEAYRQECVICATGLDDQPNEDGTFTTEFYPVDLLLALRTSDKLLEGHPFLDLKPEEGDDKPTVVIEQLRPGLVRKIKREAERGKMVAIKLRRERPPKSGQGQQLWRAQRWQPQRERKEKPGFLFVKAEDYLSEEDIHWISAVCEDGKLYLERMRAIQAMGEFVIRLRQMAERDRQRKPPKRTKKKKLKRKERRRLEETV